MLSTPPATTISLKPVWIDITPSITVRKPEPHTMLTECEQTDSGIPAANAT